MLTPNPDTALLLTIGQVAKILGVHPNTLRLWDKNGTFQSLRGNKRQIRRYPHSQVSTFLKNHCTPQPLLSSLDFPLAYRSRDLICILNTENEIIFTNRAFTSKLKYSPSSATPLLLSKIVLPQSLVTISQKKKLASLEAKYISQAKDEIWVDINMFSMPWKGQNVKVLIARDITAKKKYTQEIETHKQYLKLANQQLQDMFDHAPAGIALLDSQRPYKILSHNRVYQKMLDHPHTPLSLIDKNLFDILPDLANSRFENYFTKAATIRRGVTFYNFAFTGFDTGPVWWNGEISPIVINKKVIAFALMLIDVSEEVLAQKRLRQELIQRRHSEARLSRKNRQLLDQKIKLNLTEQASRVGVFDWTVGSAQTKWTRQLEKIYGLAPGQFKGTYEYWISLIHPEDRAKAENAISHALITGLFETEFRIIWPDGSIHWLYGRGKVFYNATKQPTSLIGINMDITNRKVTESRLAESEQRFRLIAETMVDLVTIHNPQKQYVYVSPSVVNHFHQPPQFFLSKTFYQVGFSVRLATRLNQALDRVFQTKKPLTIDFSYDNRYYQSILAPEFGTRRQVNSIIMVTRDISNLRELEKRKDEFLSIASHELKTPLASIKAYSQILKQSYSTFSSDQINSILVKQNIHIDRLNRLISDLLDLSRIQSGRFQFTESVFDFDDLVKESIESIQSFSSSHAIILSGTTGIKMKGDRHRLEQVFVNLLTNAVKYSPQAARVLVNVSVTNSQVNVSIKDFGIGIGASDKQHVFERFYRTSQVEKQYSGLGIGLFISRQIILRHRGKISFTSTLGKGSTFTFSLPVNSSLQHDKNPYL